MKEFSIDPMRSHTNFGPLAVIGEYLSQIDFFKPFEEHLKIEMKTVRHSPIDKIKDCLVSIIAGCEHISDINTKLKPELSLARVFGRDKFADQSLVSETLDRFNEDNISQLEGIVQDLLERYSIIRDHPGEELLILDGDMSGLPCSKSCEGSTKGYFHGKKNQRGRQLSLIYSGKYQEILVAKMDPGNTHCCTTLEDIVTRVYRRLGIEDGKDKPKILWRLDSGYGTDENINSLLGLKDQILVKGFSGKRAKKLARSIPENEWEEAGQDRWIAETKDNNIYSSPTRTILIRWKTPKGKIRYSYLVSTLFDMKSRELLKLYDQRQTLEAAIKVEKSILYLRKKRKKKWWAQYAIVLLTQIAHNILVWSREWIFKVTSLAKAGVAEIVKKVLPIPAKIKVYAGKIVRLSLRSKDLYAKDCLRAFQDLIGKFENPKLLDKT